MSPGLVLGDGLDHSDHSDHSQHNPVQFSAAPEPLDQQEVFDPAAYYNQQYPAESYPTTGAGGFYDYSLTQDQVRDPPCLSSPPPRTAPTPASSAA